MMTNFNKEFFNLIPKKSIYFIEVDYDSYIKNIKYEIIPYDKNISNIKYVFYGYSLGKDLFYIYKIKRSMIITPENYPMILNMPCIPLQVNYWADQYDKIILLEYFDNPISLDEIFFEEKGEISPNWDRGKSHE